MSHDISLDKEQTRQEVHRANCFSLHSLGVGLRD
jgi:hypothetical protein